MSERAPVPVEVAAVQLGLSMLKIQGVVEGHAQFGNTVESYPLNFALAEPDSVIQAPYMLEVKVKDTYQDPDDEGTLINTNLLVSAYSDFMEAGLVESARSFQRMFSRNVRDEDNVVPRLTRYAEGFSSPKQVCYGAITFELDPDGELRRVDIRDYPDGMAVGLAPEAQDETFEHRQLVGLAVGRMGLNLAEIQLADMVNIVRGVSLETGMAKFDRSAALREEDIRAGFKNISVTTRDLTRKLPHVHYKQTGSRTLRPDDPSFVSEKYTTTFFNYEGKATDNRHDITLVVDSFDNWPSAPAEDGCAVLYDFRESAEGPGDHRRIKAGSWTLELGERNAERKEVRQQAGNPVDAARIIRPLVKVADGYRKNIAKFSDTGWDVMDTLAGLGAGR